MVTSRRKKRLIRTGLVLLVVLAGAAYYGLFVSEPSWFDLATEAEGSPDESAPPPPGLEATAATAEAGIAEVEVTVRAVMPEGLDDGVPRRRFKGDGTLDLASSLAAVDYGMDEVPNSAGFFGHVSGDLEVVYSGPEFAATFPQMAEVLDDADWMSYDLGTLSNPHAIRVGIGQLREIGLSDPRLGFALLNGASEGALGEEGGEAVPIDLDTAVRETPDPDVRAIVRALRDDLHVSSAEAEGTLDAEGRVSSLSYSLTYPAAPDDVTVQVTLDLTGFDAAPIEEPDESDVASYAEYLKL